MLHAIRNAVWPDMSGWSDKQVQERIDAQFDSMSRYFFWKAVLMTAIPLVAGWLYNRNEEHRAVERRLKQYHRDHVTGDVAQ